MLTNVSKRLYLTRWSLFHFNAHLLLEVLWKNWKGSNVTNLAHDKAWGNIFTMNNAAIMTNEEISAVIGYLV